MDSLKCRSGITGRCRVMRIGRAKRRRMNDGWHTSELRSVSRCWLRARSSSAWARRADLRLIGAVQIIEAISRAPYRGPRKAGPQSDAYSTDPLGPAREAERCDNNQRNKPTYDQQGYTSAAGPASVSRTTCPLNIHEPPPYAPRRGEEEAKETSWLGRSGRRVHCDSIDLSCTLHRSIIPRLCMPKPRGSTSRVYSVPALIIS